MTSLKWPFSWALDHVKFDEMKGRFTFASRHDGVSKFDIGEDTYSQFLLIPIPKRYNNITQSL